jgi:hypothetical protein
MRRSSLLQGGDDAFRRGQMFAGRDYTPLHIYYRKSNGEECICPIGCYNSCEDIAIISFLLLTLWCLLLALYALLLKAALVRVRPPVVASRVACSTAWSSSGASLMRACGSVARCVGRAWRGAPCLSHSLSPRRFFTPPGVVRAPQDASESGTALWIFFWLGFCFVCLVHSAVYMGSQEAKNNKDEEE